MKKHQHKTSREVVRKNYNIASFYKISLTKGIMEKIQRIRNFNLEHLTKL